MKFRKSVKRHERSSEGELTLYPRTQDAAASKGLEAKDLANKRSYFYLYEAQTVKLSLEFDISLTGKQ